MEYLVCNIFYYFSYIIIVAIVVACTRYIIDDGRDKSIVSLLL